MSHHPAPTLLSRFDNQARSPTPAAGILKSRNDADITATHQNNRVSFSGRQDGTINTHITSFDVDASPKETAPNRLSLRDSMNWPPSPLPRTSTTDACRQSFSAAMQANKMARLPFDNAPAPPPLVSRPVRRYSTMEIEEIKRVDQVQVQEQAAAIPPLLLRIKSDGVFDLSRPNIRIPTSSGERRDYFLGDLAKCPSHMMAIPDNDPQGALHQVSQLKQHDFAFIKRADGSWTYAILAHRYVSKGEECMMFVLTEEGSTKTIKKKQWANFVRIVAVEEPIMDPSMPRNISVDSGKIDDFSMISFTSF